MTKLITNESVKSKVILKFLWLTTNFKKVAEFLINSWTDDKSIVMFTMRNVCKAVDEIVN